MTLAKVFSQKLNELGIDTIYIGHEKPSLQSLAIKMILKNYGLVEENREGKLIAQDYGIKLISQKGEEVSRYTFRKGGKKIDLHLPEYPKMVVDLGLFDFLDEEEREKTLFQVSLCLSVMRRFLWDGNLTIVGKTDYVLGRAKIVSNLSLSNGDKPIVLDPYGDIVATDQLLRDHNVFIIGGIVDKGRRLDRATERLAMQRGYDFPRVKIQLKGSIIGVPDEINKILEIVLRVKELGQSLEEAIISLQSKSDKISRLLHDIKQYGIEVFEEEVRWLNADIRVIEIVRSRLGRK
ncbi:tRNA methyltransferase [Sulfolobus acidocaldarius SUSAZ]|nr:tRNA methyltransferase [Sulfolobus acidocaldarius SUSAZ]